MHAPGFFQTPASAGSLRFGFLADADYQQAPSPAAADVVPAGAPAIAPGQGGSPTAAEAIAPGQAGNPAVAEAITAQAAPGGGAPQTGAAAAIAYAHSMLGKLPESSGPNEGPKLNPFEAEFGFHGAPWCGIFAGHALEAAGLHVPHSVASVAAILEIARSGEGPFEKGILPVSAVRAGDLVTFGGTEHVALVTGVDAQGIHTIAGNYSNNVTEHTYSPGEVTGVVRPRYPGGALTAASAGAGTVAPAEAAAASAEAPGPPGGAAVEAAAASTAVPPAPQTAVFHALGAKGTPIVHNTVKFLQAVQPPSAGSPVADGTQAAVSTPQGGGAATEPVVGTQQPGVAGQTAGAALEPLAEGPLSYPGDNAPKPEIARWMGELAARHGLPRELPVMAALVESSLHNDPGGDRDSVGYFQMRTSIWDSGPYAGFTRDPALQVRWFIDQALEVKKSNPSFVEDPSKWGEWIADVERPAEQYRGRYQLQLETARRLLSGQ